MTFEGCGQFDLGDGDRGVLLLHGFTGTPKDMRYVGESLADKGFRVSAPLLPGHAGDPDDLKRIGWEEWVKAAEVHWERLTKKCPVSFAAGLSMGALLTLHLCAHWKNVRAAACLATPLVLGGWRRRFLTPLLRLSPWKDFYYNKKGGIDVRDQRAKAEYPSYTRVPIAGVLNFTTLVEVVNNELYKVAAPLLLIHSRQDHTAPVENIGLVEKSVSSTTIKKAVLNDSFHVVTIDVEKERVAQEVGEFFLHFVNGPLPLRERAG